MLAKLGTLCLLLGVVVGIPTETPAENRTWDVAVTLDNEIKLLTKNGTLVASITEKFNDIKAVTYLYEDNLFIVGDRNNDDTIYVLDPITLEVTPVVKNLRDDIQGVAVDPASKIVYWTDAMKKSINFKHLNSSASKISLGIDEYQTLFDFQDQKPQDLAIDSCKRMIYWTNANINTPTIEKSTLMGTDRKVLITDVLTPTAIAIDQLAQRLYWTDMMQGIYFRIESIDLEGHDRQLLFEGTHQKPFGLTVDEDYVYWTDINDNALWRMRKHSTDAPEHIYTFTQQPNGIMSRFVGFPDEPNCEKLAVLIKERELTKENEKHIGNDNGFVRSENKTCPVCIHGKQESNCSCTCLSGYTGEQCDQDVCYNYCQNGICSVTMDSKPQCVCKAGYAGSRCEKALCDNFCLNGGVCHVTDASQRVNGLVCTCPKGFSGERCETVVPVSNYDVCKALCANSNESIVVHNEKSFLCRCSDLSYMGLESSNVTQAALVGSYNDWMIVIQHPLVIALASISTIFFIAFVVLSVYTCRLKRLRPRIKKRVVVNNVSQLTNRPTQQCEITIEDCCNMNICETPCFEPRNFQSNKKDEKKVLLGNMENNEEFY